MAEIKNIEKLTPYGYNTVLIKGNDSEVKLEYATEIKYVNRYLHITLFEYNEDMANLTTDKFYDIAINYDLRNINEDSTKKEGYTTLVNCQYLGITGFKVEGSAIPHVYSFEVEPRSVKMSAK